MSNISSEKPINGVNCVVSACIYHSESDQCLAGNIRVGNHSAATKSETDCETFNKRECCN